MISINYLPFRRPHFSRLTFHYICKIKNSLKSKIIINILTDDRNTFDWNDVINSIEKCGIKCKQFQLTDYMSKINYIIKQDTEYSIKLDEDCFCSETVWNYLLENINVLDDKQNLTFAPVLSTGIPSLEYFIYDYFDKPDIKKLEKTFLDFQFGNIWGNDYTALNKHTIDAARWEPEKYYKSVDQLPYFYKGIHPLRVNVQSQLLLLDLLLNNIDKFKNPSGLSIIEAKNRPYFCNSFFAIKTQTYRKIVNDNSLFRDPFDEVPINLYRDQNNLKLLFIKNGFGIHTVYNSVKAMDEELDFYNKLEKLIV